MQGLNLPEGSGVDVVTAQERPDLWQEARGLFGDVWPEYNLHGNETARYFGQLFPKHAHVQILFIDAATARIVARGRTIPFRWDGSLEDLPHGIDAVGLRAVDDPRPATALSALAAEVALGEQGRGLSGFLIQAMAQAARRAGLTALVAPVRPTWKDRYPITPIETYAHWKRSDGLPLDPWIRVHARLGAAILRTEPESMRIESSVDEWERWTGMSFPADGDYVFPMGLAPLRVHDGVGSYWEPNVWMHHAL